MDFVTDALRTATAQACQQAGQAPVAAVQNGMIYGASEMARKSPAELVPGFRGAFVGRDDAKCLDLQHKAASRLIVIGKYGAGHRVDVNESLVTFWEAGAASADLAAYVGCMGPGEGNYYHRFVQARFEAVASVLQAGGAVVGQLSGRIDQPHSYCMPRLDYVLCLPFFSPATPAVLTRLQAATWAFAKDYSVPHTIEDEEDSDSDDETYDTESMASSRSDDYGVEE